MGIDWLQPTTRAGIPTLRAAAAKTIAERVKEKEEEEKCVSASASTTLCVYYDVPVPVHEPPPRLITCDGDMRIGEVSDCQRTAGPRFN